MQELGTLLQLPFISGEIALCLLVCAQCEEVLVPKVRKSVVLKVMKASAKPLAVQPFYVCAGTDEKCMPTTIKEKTAFEEKKWQQSDLY